MRTGDANAGVTMYGPKIVLGPPHRFSTYDAAV
jgi:hypothetical protein